MSKQSWLNSLKFSLSGRREPIPSRSASQVRRPSLSIVDLEERCVPAIFTVNAILDDASTSSPYLTLREAIAIFNSPTMPGGLNGQQQLQISGVLHENGSDTIVFDADLGGSITLQGNQLELSLPSSTAMLTIDGGVAGVTLNANNNSRVFQVDGGVQAAFTNLTIANGTGDGGLSGGGILNSGTMTATNVTFSGNHADNAFDGGGGGGIFNNEGTVTVVASTFVGNHSNNADGGGGMFNNNGTMTVINSTFTGNHADNSGNGGGGIAQNFGTLTVIGSTFSGNFARFGGGIFMGNGTGTVMGSTVTDNHVDSFGTILGGGIYSFGGLTLIDTIVAGNDVGGSPDFNGSLPVGSRNNLIGDGTGMSGIGNNDSNGNLVGTTADPLNAKLGALANNGGPTLTHALLAGSPALSAGSAPTNLSAAMPDTTTTFVIVDDASVLAVVSNYTVILIENEQMLVTGISGNTLTVQRGYGATTAATHNVGTTVFLATDQRGSPRALAGATDIGAYQAGIALSGPILTGSVSQVDASAGGGGVAVDPNLTIAANGVATISRATVSITGNFDGSEDRLLLANQNGITGSFNTANGILTLTGTATVADYEAALRTVRYQNIDGQSPNTAQRTISFSIAPAVFNPANGHFYEFVTASGISWTDAKAAADARSLFGLQGYLTTLTSQQENDFAFSKVQGLGWIGASDAAVEGEWRWADGPENGQQFWSGGPGSGKGASGTPVNGLYNNWVSGEPNNAGNEDFAHFQPTGQWNDYPNAATVSGYVVEYGGTNGDPTLQVTSQALVNITLTTLAPSVTSPTAPQTINAATVGVTGAAVADSLVQVYLDTNNNGIIDEGDTVVGSQQLTGGATAYSITVPLTQDAVNHFLVTATVSPRRESDPVLVPSITEDSTSPETPSVTSPEKGQIVNTPTFSITGTAEAGSLVKVYRDVNNNGVIDAGDEIVGLQQLGVGVGSYSISTPLTADADNNFMVSSTDAAGNESALTDVPTIANDSVAPDAPTLTETPSNFSTGTSATFAFTSSDPGFNHFEMQLDGAEFGSATSPQSFTGLSEGSHTFQVRAVDDAGNLGIVTTYTWTVDLTVPTAKISSSPPLFSNSTSATFRFTGSDPLSNGVSTGVNRLEISLDGAEFIAAGSPQSFSGLSEGSHIFQVRAIDNAGNIGDPMSYTWTVDITVPVAPAITGNPPAFTNSTEATFGFTDTDPGFDHFETQVDGGGFVSATNPQTFADLSEGNHTFQVRAVDHAGNFSLPTVYTWSVDLTAPTTAITAMPVNVANSTTATFNFTGVDPASNGVGSSINHFETNLDGAGFATSTSPEAFTGLTEGSHTYQVRAIDNVGNVGMPVSYTWTVDVTAPTVAITAQPPVFINSTSATFVFASSDEGLNHLETKLDGAAFVTGTSPLSYTGLSEGVHTFQVRAVDNAGNISTPTTYTWTVDLTIPTEIITSQPSPFTSSTSATFTFIGADKGQESINSGVNHLETRLDGAEFATATSAQTFDRLAEGSHTFQVRSIDNAGNVGTPESYTWTIDVTAPTVTMTANPPSFSTSTSATFVFAGTDPASSGVGSGVNHLEISLDGAAFATATSPQSFTGLTEGSHTFQARAVDNAGIVGAAAVYTWTVDISAPAVTLTANPPSFSNSTSATFNFSAVDENSGVNHLETRLDGAAFAPSTSPVTFNGLYEGSHTFQVRAVNNAGLMSTPITCTWTVDVTVPTATITAHPASFIDNTPASFSFIGTDPAANGVGSGINHLETAIDGAAFATATTAQVLSGLAEGNHTFQVRSIDNAGNIGTPVSFTWAVDLSTPTVSIAANPPAFSNSTAGTFSFIGVDPASNGVGSGINHLETRIDGGEFATATSPQTFTGLSEGNHTVQVRSIDGVGHVSTSVSYTWMVDLTVPMATINATPPAFSNSTTGTFSFSGSDLGGVLVNSGVNHLETQLDGAAFATATSPQSFTGLAEGSHTVRVRTVDNAGNVSGTVSYTWAVDLTVPTAVTTTSPPSLSNSTSATLTFNGNDPASNGVSSGVSRLESQLDGAGFATATSPQTFTGLTEGSHTFQVRSIDIAGNVGTPTTFIWTIDVTLPVAAITANPPSFTNSSVAVFNFTSTNLDVNHFETRFDGSGFATATGPQTFTGLTEGNHTFQVRAIDNAGNIGTPVSYTWVVDVSAPTAAITANPPSLTNVTAATFNFTGIDAASNGVGSGVNHLETAIDGGGFTTATSPQMLTGLTEGTHTFQVRAVDNAGNIGTPVAYTWTVDVTAPTIAVSLPSGPTSSVGPVTYTVTYANYQSISLDVSKITLNRTGDANGSVGLSTIGNVATVTISALTGNGTLSITIAAGTAVDQAGNLAAVAGPSATIAVVNNAPTTPGILDQTVNEDSNTLSLDLTAYFSDAQEPSSALVYTIVGNSNAGLMSTTAIVGTTLNMTPAVKANGSSTLIVRATDGTGRFVETSFTLIVTPVNDAPTLAPINDINLNIGEDAPPQTINLTGISAGPANESTQHLTITATSDNVGLIPNPVVQYTTGSNGTLTFTPMANSNGVAHITVTVVDDGGGQNSVTQTFTVTIASSADRPVLDTTPTIMLPAIAVPVVGTPTGALLSTLTANQTDPDAGALKGVAITAVDNTNGKWQYSLDGGATWIDMARNRVADDSALLLADNGATRVRFVPLARFKAGFADLTYKAWDQTNGAIAGTMGNTTNSTDMSFGLQTEFAWVAVGKTTPKVDAQGHPLLAPIHEDTKNTLTAGVKSVMGLIVKEQRILHPVGMAISDADQSNGTWQFNTGTGWRNVGSVSDNAALLLGPNDRVRFMPKPDFDGQATLTYHTWDLTNFKHGTTQDTSGGQFSVPTETAIEVMIPVNDRPMLDTTPGVTLAPIVQGGTTSAVPINSFLNATDIDSSTLGIAIIATTGAGTWQYLPVGGSWTNVSAVTPFTALFLDNDVEIRFVSRANAAPSTATMSFRAWDESTFVSGQRGVIAGPYVNMVTEVLSVAIGNTAPVMSTTGTRNLTPVHSSGLPSAGNTASYLLGNSVSDPGSYLPRGIAISFANDTNGTWQFLVTGGTWTAVGKVSDTNVRLLTSTNLIRFVPNAGYVGSASIQFQAWDQTAGQGGDLLDPTNLNSFSPTTATATVAVSA